MGLYEKDVSKNSIIRLPALYLEQTVLKFIDDGQFSYLKMRMCT